MMKVMTMITTLIEIDITPIMDIFCKIPIYFLRRKKRLRKIATIVMIILTSSPKY
jgi:hypothetical protein